MDNTPNHPESKGLMNAIHQAFAENVERVHLDVRSMHVDGELQLRVQLHAIKNNAFDLVGDAIIQEPGIMNSAPLKQQDGHLIIPITPEMLDNDDFCDGIHALDEIMYRPDAPHP